LAAGWAATRKATNNRQPITDNAQKRAHVSSRP
jgi:hypothetical protein